MACRSSSVVEHCSCKAECVGSNPTSGFLSANQSREGKSIALGVDVRAGCNRAKRLTPAQRELYRWILRAFAEHGSARVEELVEVASSLGLEVEQALAQLAEEDLVHRDPGNGEIVVAYPFSGAPTAHRVGLDRGSEVFAMCAVDALGIPFMLDKPGEIRSRDPLTGAEISVRIEPGVAIDWRPDAAVVLWGATSAGGPSTDTCCQYVHLFSSTDSARRYVAGKSGVRGQILAVPSAAEAGKAIFGDVLSSDD
jgi:hypothetical protein